VTDDPSHANNLPGNGLQPWAILDTCASVNKQYQPKGGDARRLGR